MPAHRIRTTVKLSQDDRLQSTSHVVSYLLRMQNMIVKEPRTVLLWDYVSISFHILYDIAFKRFETIMIMFQLT